MSERRRLLVGTGTIPDPVAAGPPEGDARGRLADIGVTLEAAFDQLRRLQARDPAFTAPPPDYRAVRDAAVAHECCFVYLHGPLHPEDPLRGWVVHTDSPPDNVPDADRLIFPGLTRESLLRFLRGPAPGRPADEVIAADACGEAIGWEEAYAARDRLGTPGWIRWERTVNRVLGELGPALAAPLATRLRAISASRVFLLPDGLLAPFPIAALPLGGPDGDTLGDRFAVSVVPSAATAQECLESKPPSSPAAPEFVAVVNPDGSLPFSEDQVGQVASRFAQVAAGPAARREWLFEHVGRADFVSFATHGVYEPEVPSRSRLPLAHRLGTRVKCERGKNDSEFDGLRLGDLWARRLALRRGCVVTAEACETGQLDPHIGHDESLGFPAAFLAAGASGVVATLWSVSDFASALIMNRVYARMLAGRLAPSAVAGRGDSLGQGCRGSGDG